MSVEKNFKLFNLKTQRKNLNHRRQSLILHLNRQLTFALVSLLQSKNRELTKLQINLRMPHLRLPY